MGVEIRHLAALRALDAERSFRAAAERLGYVQSAVSQQLSALESLVGTQLVERVRGHARVELTRAGTILLAHANRILAELAAARADIQALSEKDERTLRVGAAGSAMSVVMPRVLSRLASQSPSLRIAAIEARATNELADAVASGSLDCALGELPLEAGPFEAIELLLDPHVLIVDGEAPSSSAEMLDGPQLVAGVPLALPTSSAYESIRRQLHDAGYAPARWMSFQTDCAVRAMAQAGVAAGILPWLAATPAPPGTRLIGLDSVLAPRAVVLYWHKDRIHGHTLGDFARAARAVCREIQARDIHSLTLTAPTTTSPPPQEMLDRDVARIGVTPGRVVNVLASRR